MAISGEPQPSPAGAIPGSPSSIVRTPSLLGPGLQIKGQVTGAEDLKIDGKVEGPISLGEYRLTVGPTARIKGALVAREIVVYGGVEGNLQAGERLEIKKDGSVVGELTTARIMIEDGAYVKGTVEITRSKTQANPDPDTLLTLAEKDFKLKAARAGSESTQ